MDGRASIGRASETALNAVIAQSVERGTYNLVVDGSSPSDSTNSAWTPVENVRRVVRHTQFEGTDAWVLGSPERSPSSPDVVIAVRSLPKAGT